MDYETKINIGGTLIWYYYICRREVWLLGRGIEPEQENDYIALGRHIHEIFYTRRKKELTIDNTIKIDILPGRKVIGEIKKSTRYLESAKMQVAFYLYYMKKEKGVVMEGLLLVPEERKRIKVSLTPDIEEKLVSAIKDIEKILSMERPPSAVKIPYCKKCAYRDMCWA